MTALAPDTVEDVLALVAGEALGEARWERLDLLTRRAPEEVAAVLAARMRELAASPSGRDQLLALAFQRLTEGGGNAGPHDLLGAEADPAEREALRRRVLGQDGHPVDRALDLVARYEARLTEAGPQAPRILAERLMTDADLNEFLWDDPRIPAGDDVRLTMLCSISRLRDRADELTAPHQGGSILEGRP